jgi:hypothetical protein
MQPDGHSIDEELSDAAAVGGTKEVGVMVAELPAGLPSSGTKWRQALQRLVRRATFANSCNR